MTNFRADAASVKGTPGCSGRGSLDRRSQGLTPGQQQPPSIRSGPRALLTCRGSTVTHVGSASPLGPLRGGEETPFYRWSLNRSTVGMLH